jgi:hypothetical protein
MSKQTKSKRKTLYHYESFPFEKMSIVTEGKGFFKNKDYNRTGISTLVDGNDYKIEFDRDFKSGPVIYLIYKESPTKPSLATRCSIHPRWEEKGEDGKSKRIESEVGKKVKAFWVRFRARLIELLSQIPNDKLARLIGKFRADNIEGTLSDIVTFPTMEDTDDVPDEEKSEQFKCKIWTADYNKLLLNTERPPPPREELLMIPGTDIVIYTNCKKMFGDGSSDDGKKIMKYEKLKPFVYCKTQHENACNRYFGLALEPIINAPCLSYGKEAMGSVKLPLGDIIFTNKKIYGSDGNLSASEMEKIKKRRLEQMEELGFGVNDYESAMKKPKQDEEEGKGSEEVKSDGKLPSKNEVVMNNNLSDGDDDHFDYDDMSG